MVLTLWTSKVALAVTASVPSETINGIGLWYTLSRVAYGFSYALIESEPWSFLRSLFLGDQKLCPVRPVVGTIQLGRAVKISHFQLRILFMTWPCTSVRR